MTRKTMGPAGRMLAGALAGAAGTTALNAATYMDMALTARGGSGLPERLVDVATRKAGVSLGEEDRAGNRRQALGALIGFGVGVGVGVVYGAADRAAYEAAGPSRPLGRPASAAGLALTAMLVADGPAAALKLTDPRTWGVRGWLSDLAPHLAYGAVTAAAYHRLTHPTTPPLRRS